VDSALNQTFGGDFEVLLVDDGGTIPALELLKAEILCNPKLRIIRQENLGLGAARDRGVRAAAGTWVTFLDADDVLALNKLEEQIACIDALNTSEAVIFTGTEIRPSGKLKWCLRGDGKVMDITTEVLCGRQPSGASMMIPRALYFKVGGFEADIRRNCEVCLIGKLYGAGTRFYVIPKPLYVQNITRSSNRMRINYRYDSLKKSVSIVRGAFEKGNVVEQFSTFFRRRIIASLKVALDGGNSLYAMKLIKLFNDEGVFKKIESLWLYLYVLLNIATFGFFNRLVGRFLTRLSYK
jgi:glycosyltransferase involved in cell wall biosynthesis